ncbi:hypothetical protein Jiend_37220 [Micromonospora endophytica]|nr:hypothetical protein Jiend_37220 [Micromonospora endophytica]
MNDSLEGWSLGTGAERRSWSTFRDATGISSNHVNDVHRSGVTPRFRQAGTPRADPAGRKAASPPTLRAPAGLDRC